MASASPPTSVGIDKIPGERTVFIATSLDGFIAREGGEIDWLPVGDQDGGAEEDHGYTALFESVDALVMGRNTYDLVRSFGGAWPYGKKPIRVITTRGVEIPPEIRETVRQVSGTPTQIVQELADEGLTRLYVDGGVTIQSFLAEGLIDRMIITRVPVLIGRGIPLFGPLPADIRLRHVATRTYSSGLVQSEYEVVRPLRPSS